MTQTLRLVLAATSLAFAANGAPRELFDAPRLFWQQGGAVAVAAGDFNGDGNMDLAAVSSTGVSILLGRGNGVFEQGATYAVAPKSYFGTPLVTADFNGDDKLDLALVAQDPTGTPTVAVMLGNGDGTFQAPVYYAAGVEPLSLTVADFNNDGKLDVAANEGNPMGGYTSTVSVLLGNGDGTFQPPSTLPLPGAAGCIAAADLNGDGNADLILPSWPNGWVFLGNGDSTFQPPLTFSTGGASTFSSVAVADFNGDGIPDLGLGVDNGDVGILLGNGDGTFQPPVRYGGVFDPMGVAAGDLNGDGKPDLVATDSFGGTVVFLNAGNGTLLPAQFYATGEAYSALLLADLNGDHNLDIALAGTELSGPGPVTILLGNGRGSFQHDSYYTGGLYTCAITAGDFNGDGKPDLVLLNGNSGGNTAAVLIGNGDGSFQPPVAYALGNEPTAVASGDFNGDGKLDLAVFGVTGTPLAILLGNGDGTFQPPVHYYVGSGGGAEAIAIGDFNGDGKLDLALTLYSNVEILLGKGDGTFQPSKTFPTGSDSYAVATADFNGDGKLDLAVVNQRSDNVSILLGDGKGSFQKAVNYAVGQKPDWVAIADFNGDGIPDLAVANMGSGNISVLLGNGDGTFQAAVNHPEAGGAALSVVAGDFNGDGNQDLAAVMGRASGMAILLGNGKGGFQRGAQAAEFALPPFPAAAVVGDFNLDAKPDLAVVTPIGATILLNRR